MPRVTLDAVCKPYSSIASRTQANVKLKCNFCDWTGKKSRFPEHIWGSASPGQIKHAAQCKGANNEAKAHSKDYLEGLDEKNKAAADAKRKDEQQARKAGTRLLYIYYLNDEGT